MKRGEWKKDKEDRGLYRRNKTWWIRYVNRDGKLTSERSGLMKSDALNLYRRRKDETEDAKYHPEKLRKGILFDELISDVIAITQTRYEKKYPKRVFKPGRLKIVKSWFAGRRASAMTTAEIRQTIDEHSPTPATHNRYRTILNHVFRVALENEKVDRNPIAQIKQMKENNERVRYLNQHADDEEDRLRAAIKKSRYPQREPEVDLALATGMRQQELYQLLWPDVDLLRGQITIQQSKANRREFIPINQSARAALAKLRALAPKSERVCPLGYSSRHRRWWVSVRKAAKLNDLRWHDLRHTFASRLVMAGCDLYTVSKLLRHATTTMTARYAHLSQGHLERAIAKLDPPEKVLQPSETPRELVQ